MPELIFTVARASPSEFRLLAEALRRDVVSQDAAAAVTEEPPRPRPDRVYVAIGASERVRDASREQRQRTIMLSPAQPGTPEHEAALELAPHLGLTLHPNFFVTRELLENGVRAAHLQLGYTATWDRFDDSVERPLDIEEAGHIDRLCEAKLALIRGGSSPLAFDWLHALLAIHHGAVVLHEHCFGAAPLIAGRHAFFATDDSLDAVADALLADPDRLSRVATESHRFLSEILPMSVAASALLGHARTLLVQSVD